VTWDEVQSGEIRHAIRFTAPQTRREFVWPARHYASSLTGTQYPRMGERFRLKASFNIAPYPAEVQVILRAMKKYGIVLADNGSAWFISGRPDPRWNDDHLHTLSRCSVRTSRRWMPPSCASARLRSRAPERHHGDGDAVVSVSARGLCISFSATVTGAAGGVRGASTTCRAATAAASAPSTQQPICARDGPGQTVTVRATSVSVPTSSSRPRDALRCRRSLGEPPRFRRRPSR
jgi:hypothetical protein